VTHGLVDVLRRWVTAVNHESVDELHGLGSLASQLTRDDDLATLSSALHNEAKHTVAGPANVLIPALIHLLSCSVALISNCTGSAC